MLKTIYTNLKKLGKYLSEFNCYLILIFISISDSHPTWAEEAEIDVYKSYITLGNIVPYNLARNIDEGNISIQRIIFIFSHEFLALIFIFLSFIVVISLIQLNKRKVTHMLEKRYIPGPEKSDLPNEIKESLELLRLERENNNELRKNVASEKESSLNNALDQFKNYFKSAEKKEQKMQKKITQTEFEKNQLEEDNIQLRSKIAYSLLSSHTLKNSTHSGFFNYSFLPNKLRRKKLHFINKQTIFYEELHSYSTRDSIKLADEIDFIKLYCSLFEKKNIDFLVKNNFENLDGIIVPSLLTIAIVENSINKGFRRHNSIPNKIVFEINSLPKGFEIVITDNGIGKTAYETQKDNLKKYINSPINSGTGISGLVERINAINLKSEGQMFIKLKAFSLEDQPIKLFGFESGFTNQLTFYKHENSNSR